MTAWRVKIVNPRLISEYCRGNDKIFSIGKRYESYSLSFYLFFRALITYYRGLRCDGR